MPLPSRALQSRDGFPGLPTGVERRPNASETGAYVVEHPVGSEFSPHGFPAVLDNLWVKRKGIPGLKGRFCKPLKYLGTVIGTLFT